MTSDIKSQINKILDKIPSLNVLVVGDCMLDHYLWGDVHRISPEAQEKGRRCCQQKREQKVSPYVNLLKVKFLTISILCPNCQNIMM